MWIGGGCQRNANASTSRCQALSHPVSLTEDDGLPSLGVATHSPEREPNGGRGMPFLSAIHAEPRQTNQPRRDGWCSRLLPCTCHGCKVQPRREEDTFQNQTREQAPNQMPLSKHRLPCAACVRVRARVCACVSYLRLNLYPEGPNADTPTTRAPWRKGAAEAAELSSHHTCRGQKETTD